MHAVDRQELIGLLAAALMRDAAFRPHRRRWAARARHRNWRFPHILGLDVAGVVDTVGSRSIPWQQIPAGLDRLADGHVRGKIVAQNELGSALGVRMSMT
jgi:hypothetical protein